MAGANRANVYRSQEPVSSRMGLSMRWRWTGALVDQLVEPLKQGVVLDRIHGSSMRGRCLTSGLVHSSTNS